MDRALVWNHFGEPDSWNSLWAWLSGDSENRTVQAADMFPYISVPQLSRSIFHKGCRTTGMTNTSASPERDPITGNEAERGTTSSINAVVGPPSAGIAINSWVTIGLRSEYCTLYVCNLSRADRCIFTFKSVIYLFFRIQSIWCIYSLSSWLFPLPREQIPIAHLEACSLGSV